MLKTGLAPILLVALLVLGGCESGDGDSGIANGSSPRPPADRAWVIFGSDTVVAEVADSDEERQDGLMNRPSLDAGAGMLFVFEQERTLSFWMRNTLIPLDIAFIDDTQVIVDIQQMEPLTEEYHQSERPAMFALEVPQGWFEAQGIEVGDAAQIVFGRLM